MSIVERLQERLPRPFGNLLRWARSDEALNTAASLAFFAMVSLPPTLLIGLWIAAAVAGDERIAQFGQQVSDVAPSNVGADGVLDDLVTVATTLGWTSILAALWPATAYGAGLARAFDNLTPTGRRKMDGIRGRVFVIVIIALLPLAVMAALLVVLFAPRMLGDELLIRIAGYFAAAVVTIAALTAVLALLYDLFSPADVGVRAASKGAAWAAGMITAISLGYVVYLRLGANFEQKYGSSAFAAAILLGLWLYLTNGALIIGYKRALISAGIPAWQDPGGRGHADGR